MPHSTRAPLLARLRGRVVDVFAAAGGVLVLLALLTLIDHRIRDAVTSRTGAVATSADVATLGHHVNSLAMAAALVVMPWFRSQAADHSQLVLFTVTAAVLVVLLMRL